MQAVAPNVPGWPGITFDISTREAQALLGTPNGSGVAWMLPQHQSSFGNKKVQSTTIFENEKFGQSLVFALGEDPDPREPMALDWGWQAPDGDPMDLNRRGTGRRF